LLAADKKTAVMELFLKQLQAAVLDIINAKRDDNGAVSNNKKMLSATVTIA
jgi:hypothetical protein